jgi:hypothetical protein
VEENSTPFHFLKREMNEDEQRQLMQKKIFDNPSLYISTHVLPHSRRSSARSATSISNWNSPIITPASTFRRRNASPRY